MGIVGLLKKPSNKCSKGQPPSSSGCLSLFPALTINDQPVENRRQKSEARRQRATGRGAKVQWKYQKLKNMP